LSSGYESLFFPMPNAALLMGPALVDLVGLRRRKR